jgi:thiamine biosynthesis lipoprotein
VQKLTLAQDAMATRFEFVLLGSNPVQLRAAGEEAFGEIERIESQLSLYRSGSEIALVNAGASFRPVRVSPPTFALLEKARAFWELSGGSFDITIAPLVRAWGFMKGSGARPTDSHIAEAREVVGMQHLELDPDASTVRFKRAGMMIDLGSIGKGYALDIAAAVLRDAGVENGLLHGGTSTILGLGSDLSGPWKVALDRPALPSNHSNSTPDAPPAEKRSSPLAVIELQNQAMSVSAIWGKFFVLEGKTYGHVIDPRTGWPVENALLGCVVVDSAGDSDALSTAVLLGSEPDLQSLAEKIPNLRYLQASRTDEQSIRFLNRGIDVAQNGSPVI